ncbi:hypothetical protein ID914_004648 [Salmonella enterica]|nr:hypothetical protein [Salmonella enterica]
MTSSADGAMPHAATVAVWGVYATEISACAISHNLHGHSLPCGNVNSDA